MSPAPTALQLTPQPAAAPSSSTAGGLSSRLAAQQQQQQQLWGQQGGLATPVMHDAAGVPEQPGSSALLLHSLAASVPQSRAGLSVKLEGEMGMRKDQWHCGRHPSAQLMHQWLALSQVYAR